MYFGQYDKSLREKKKLRIFDGVDEESDYLDFMYLCRLEGPLFSKSFECLLLNTLFLIFLSIFNNIFSLIAVLIILQYITCRNLDYEFLHDQLDEEPEIEFMDDIGLDYHINVYSLFFYDLLGMVKKIVDDQRFINYGKIIFELYPKYNFNKKIYNFNEKNIIILKKKYNNIQLYKKKKLLKIKLKYKFLNILKKKYLLLNINTLLKKKKNKVLYNKKKLILYYKLKLIFFYKLYYNIKLIDIYNVNNKKFIIYYIKIINNINNNILFINKLFILKLNLYNRIKNLLYKNFLLLKYKSISFYKSHINIKKIKYIIFNFYIIFYKLKIFKLWKYKNLLYFFNKLKNVNLLKIYNSYNNKSNHLSYTWWENKKKFLHI